MDFEKLAAIFEQRAAHVRRWADRKHEYKIADELDALASDIRIEIAKSESDQ
jgi:hypothetical protein